MNDKGKKAMKKILFTLFAVALGLFLGACSNMLQPPEKSGSRPAGGGAWEAPSGGKSAAKLEVQISNPSARTLLPDIRFSKIDLELTWQGGATSTINWDSLEAALKSAYGARAGVTYNTSAANVAYGASYVSSAAWNNFNNVITQAEAMYKTDANIEQTEVNTIVTALTAANTGAIAVFNAAKGTGTKIVRQDLINALTAAEEAKAGPSSSTYANRTRDVPNTSAASVSLTVYYRNSTSWTTFETAIETARTTLRNLNATQTDIAAQVTALTAATSTFNALTRTVGSGRNTIISTSSGSGRTTTTTITLSRTTVSAALKAADTARAAVVYYTSNGTVSASAVPRGVTYVNGTGSSSTVSQTRWNTFNTAITTAQTSYYAPVASTTSTTPTQTTVNGYATTLNTAVTTFKTYLSTGTGSVATTDRTSLNTAIQNAYMAKLGVVTATSASTAAKDRAWATAAQLSTLNAKITEAEAVAYNDFPGNFSTMLTGSGSLATATTTFNTAVTANGVGTSVTLPPIGDQTRSFHDIPGTTSSIILDIPVLGMWKVDGKAYVKVGGVDTVAVTGTTKINISGVNSRGTLSLTNLITVGSGITNGTFSYSISNIGLLSQTGDIKVIWGAVNGDGLPVTVPFINGNPRREGWNPLGDYLVGSIPSAPLSGDRSIAPGYYGMRIWYYKKIESVESDWWLMYDELIHIYPGHTTIARVDMRNVIEGSTKSGGFQFEGPGDETIVWSETMGDTITLAIANPTGATYEEFKWFFDNTDITTANKGVTATPTWTTPVPQDGKLRFFRAAKTALTTVPGPHYITVLVKDSNGNWYSKRVTFSVGY